MRTKIAQSSVASDFRVDGAKLPEIPRKEGALGSEIAARNRKSLATFYRTLKSQCSHCFQVVLEIASDFWGPRWASQSQTWCKNRCDFGALSSLKGTSNSCQVPIPWEFAGVFLTVILWQHPSLERTFLQVLSARSKACV